MSSEDAFCPANLVLKSESAWSLPSFDLFVTCTECKHAFSSQLEHLSLKLLGHQVLLPFIVLGTRHVWEQVGRGGRWHMWEPAQVHSHAGAAPSEPRLALEDSEQPARAELLFALDLRSLDESG